MRPFPGLFLELFVVLKVLGARYGPGRVWSALVKVSELGRLDVGTGRGRRLSASRRVGDANQLTLIIRAETAGGEGSCWIQVLTVHWRPSCDAV